MMKDKGVVTPSSLTTTSQQYDYPRAFAKGGGYKVMFCNLLVPIDVFLP